MTLSEIANIRLQSQHISRTEFKTPKELVAWMGAMQAQDYAMSKWAVGARIQNSTDEQVQHAIDKGEIIRTHVLRPTWHFVSPEDIYWMLELTSPQIKTAMKSRDKELGLTEKIYLKSQSVIEKLLAKNKNSTRDELIDELKKAKIATDEYRSGHLMLRAELDGLVCSGATKNKKQTYSLLSNRVAKRKTITKEEALAKLAKKYFSSHGPATLKDFIWWSGLKVKDARDALEFIKKDFSSTELNGETYWFDDSFSKSPKKASVYLLPSYDEFTISYKNREASLVLEHQKNAFSSNGIFRPLIVINGQATGIWKRTFRNDTVIIEPDFFVPHSKKNIQLIKKEAEKFGDFLGKKTELIEK